MDAPTQSPGVSLTPVRIPPVPPGVAWGQPIPWIGRRPTWLLHRTRPSLRLDAGGVDNLIMRPKYLRVTPRVRAYASGRRWTMARTGGWSVVGPEQRAGVEAELRRDPASAVRARLDMVKGAALGWAAP